MITRIVLAAAAFLFLGAGAVTSAPDDSCSPLVAQYDRSYRVISSCTVATLERNTVYRYDLTMVNDTTNTVTFELVGGAVNSSPFGQKRWSGRTFSVVTPCSMLTRGFITLYPPVGSGMGVTIFREVIRELGDSAGIWLPKDNGQFIQLPDIATSLPKEKALSGECR